MAKRFTVTALCSYPGEPTVATPEAKADEAGLTAWVYALVRSEPHANRFVIVVERVGDDSHG